VAKKSLYSFVFLRAFETSWRNHSQKKHPLYSFVFLRAFVSSWRNHSQKNIRCIPSCFFVPSSLRGETIRKKKMQFVPSWRNPLLHYLHLINQIFRPRIFINYKKHITNINHYISAYCCIIIYITHRSFPNPIEI